MSMSAIFDIQDGNYKIRNLAVLHTGLITACVMFTHKKTWMFKIS